MDAESSWSLSHGVRSFLLVLSSGLIGAAEARAQVHDVETRGRCAAVIGQVTGDVSISCPDQSTPDVPVYSSYVALYSFHHENTSFIEFLEENLYRVVYLRLKVDDRRQFTSLDSAVVDFDVCGNEGYSIFDEDGWRLFLITAENVGYYRRFPSDFRWQGSREERRRVIDEVFPNIDFSCSAAVSVSASRVYELVDRGSELIGFFHVTDVGGHATRPVIRLDEVRVDTIALQATAAAMRAAEEARFLRTEEFFRRLDE